MNINEAINILTNNGYLIEKLNLKEPREEYYSYIPNLHPLKRLTKPKLDYFNYGNDGRPFLYRGNTQVKDFKLNCLNDYKKLLNIENDKNYDIKLSVLKSISENPDDYCDIIKAMQSKFPNYITDNLLTRIKYMKHPTQKEVNYYYDCLLTGYITVLQKIINDVASGKILIYRGIGLPKTIDINNYIKTHHSFGTSWSISENCASIFAYMFVEDDENIDKELEPYLITAKVKNINNIDIPTTILNWYEFGCLLENPRNSEEQEIRIKNSNNLEIISIEKI